ncbi:MAG: glycosyltransferase [Firmicutes bacterium]|uniref:Glycosyltransferase n=1 Tax=Candidatus Onthovivens merdipullorum TaxID=2840889 RepID=A0A9D9DJA2_9BACL|nr:glycosyltransferase [Candidatus Onthovivens merdipullorum]
MKVFLYFQGQSLIRKSGIGRALLLQSKALKSAGIEITLDIRDQFDIGHVNTLWPKSHKIERFIKKQNIPLVVHGHSIFSDMKNSFRCWRILSIFYKASIKKCFKYADVIITPTEYSKKVIESYKCVKCKVYDVSNGIDLKEYRRDQEKIDLFKTCFNIAEGQKVVIGIGLPIERKGILEFFRIAQEFKDVTFIWFGDMAKITLPHKINHAIKKRPRNVIMPGYIDNDILKGALQYASCFLFPTKEETEGIVVLEALASYTPMLISNIPTYKEWLTDGKDCYKANSIMEFITKLKFILTHDNSEIVKNGYEVVKERSIDKIGQKLKKIYEEVYNEKKKNN